MTTTEIAALRLHNQQITQAKFTSPAAVVGWMGAMQAQDYTHAKWAIGLRLPGLTDTDVEAAIDRGDLVRTHLLRPTWHFVAAEDVRWMLALSAPQIRMALSPTNRQIGVEGDIFARSYPILVKALAGGQHLTLVSYKDRTASLYPSRRVQTITSNGLFKPVVVKNGWVNGVWQRTVVKNHVSIVLELFGYWEEVDQLAFQREAARFAGFLGKSLRAK